MSNELQVPRTSGQMLAHSLGQYRLSKQRYLDNRCHDNHYTMQACLRLLLFEMFKAETQLGREHRVPNPYTGA